MKPRTPKRLGSALARKITLATDAAPSRLASAHDGLENVVAGLGTSRDKRSFSVWAFPRVMTRDELENMYRGSWLAKRIVNTVADDMTREWLHVMFDGFEDNGQFVIEQAEKRLGLRAKVNEALRWARLYGGSLMIIGASDTQDLSKPLTIETMKKGSLKYVQVVDRWRVSPSGVLTKQLDSYNFGLPDTYVVAESSVVVHHTRVLRFNGQKLPYFAWMQNAMWDDSELQHVVESLLNCDTATAAVATMLFEANVDVVKSPSLTELLATKDGEAKAIKRFQLAAMMKSFNRTLLLDGQEEYEKKQNSFANLDDIVERFMIDVCGAADIPMVRLFGQSAGGLNATGDNDVRNYYDMVSAKQEAEMRPALDRLYEMICRSELGTVPKDFRYDFNPLWQISDKEQAEIDKSNAERDKTYIEAGVLTEGAVARELKERGTYRTMTDEDVELAEELAEPSDEDAALVGQPPVKPGSPTPPTPTQKEAP